MQVVFAVGRKRSTTGSTRKKKKRKNISHKDETGCFLVQGIGVFFVVGGPVGACGKYPHENTVPFKIQHGVPVLLP